MVASALAVLLLAAPVPSALTRALDAKLAVDKRVAALDELTRAPRLEDLDRLRPLSGTEDPTLLAAWLRFLAAVPAPESIEIVQALYAKTPDPKLKVAAVAALQPTADTLPFFRQVLATELPPETDALHSAALEKLSKLGGSPAAIEVLRYETRDDVTLAAQRDALFVLRAAEPARVSAFARRHAASPNPAIAAKAKQLVEAMKRR